MKFLQLRHALIESGLVQPAPIVVATRRQKKEPKSPKPTKSVVMSDGISRTAVNKQTALLVAKAPWWAHAPEGYGKTCIWSNDKRSIEIKKESGVKNKQNHRKPEALVPSKEAGQNEKGKTSKTEKGVVERKHQTKQELRKKMSEDTQRAFVELKSLLQLDVSIMDKLGI
jgi:hypothetical protein